MRALVAALSLLILPAAGLVQVHENVAIAPQVVAGPVTLAQGDIGTATLGASAHSASVTVALPLVANDVLKLQSASSLWQVHAVFVSQAGYTGLAETVTVALAAGANLQTQVTVTAGVVLQSSGAPVDLPTGTPAELRVSGVGTGTMTVHLVVAPDAGGPVARYAVVLTS